MLHEVAWIYLILPQGKSCGFFHMVLLIQNVYSAMIYFSSGNYFIK